MEGTLFEITERYQQLLAFAEDGDIDDEVFAETLQGIEDELELKAENYVRVIKELEIRKGSIGGEISVIQAEVDRRKELVNSIDRHIAKMKESLCNAMVATGKQKFKTEHFSFWTQETASVVIDDPANIPMDFYRVREPEVNKEAIKKALNNGETFEFAHLEKKSGVRFK